MNKRLEPDEFVAILREVFAQGKELTFTPSGTSMLPMLDGVEDKVTFSPKPERLKRYDVAFYRRDSGQLVLHRLVGYKDGAYVFSGDNQYYYEYGVRDDNILALMTAFTHKGKSHRVDEFGYRVYIRRMMLKKRLRIFALRVYRLLFPNRSH